MRKHHLNECRHVEEIFVTVSMWSCLSKWHLDNFRCSQKRKFRQNGDTFRIRNMRPMLTSDGPFTDMI